MISVITHLPAFLGARLLFYSLHHFHATYLTQVTQTLSQAFIFIFTQPASTHPVCPILNPVLLGLLSAMLVT